MQVTDRFTTGYFYPRPPYGGRPRVYGSKDCSCAFLSTPSVRRATQGSRGSSRGHHISIHALRTEGDVVEAYYALCTFKISIHALRTEGDRATRPKCPPQTNFYPRPPYGGRHVECTRLIADADFYPRPPYGGRRVLPALIAADFIISIHALRTEGDRCFSLATRILADFYPRPPYGGRPQHVFQHAEQFAFLSTPSVRRATQFACILHAQCAYFYPRPPYGGRPCTLPVELRQHNISIHALRTEGDRQKAKRCADVKLISIHALRTEGDVADFHRVITLQQFLSTPSVRRATSKSKRRSKVLSISIHALRTEGDVLSMRFSFQAAHFYPRPPYGGRR